MRKVILNLCTSLDGYIEGVNGEIDWCFTDQDYGMTPFLESIDTIFIGRKSYEQLLELMPEGFSGKKMIIFSSTSTFSDQRVISKETLESDVNSILTSKGKSIWLFGGAELIHVLLEKQYIDELIVSIHPLILGAGKPLIKALSERVKLELLSSESFSTGLIQVHYSVIKK